MRLAYISFAANSVVNVRDRSARLAGVAEITGHHRATPDVEKRPMEWALRQDAHAKASQIPLWRNNFDPNLTKKARSIAGAFAFTVSDRGNFGWGDPGCGKELYPRKKLPFISLTPQCPRYGDSRF